MSRYDNNFPPCSIEDLIITVITSNRIAKDFDLEFDNYYVAAYLKKTFNINQILKCSSQKCFT